MNYIHLCTRKGKWTTVSPIEGKVLRIGGGMQQEKIMEKKKHFPISFEDDIFQSCRKNIS